MNKLYLTSLILSVAALAACDGAAHATPVVLQDQQIVCSLKGEAFIFRDDNNSYVHSVRSQESDSLCAPMKAAIHVKADVPEGASQ